MYIHTHPYYIGAGEAERGARLSRKGIGAHWKPEASHELPCTLPGILRARRTGCRAPAGAIAHSPAVKHPGPGELAKGSVPAQCDRWLPQTRPTVCA